MDFESLSPFERGFLKKAFEAGLTEAEALDFLKEAAMTQAKTSPGIRPTPAFNPKPVDPIPSAPEIPKFSPDTIQNLPKSAPEQSNAALAPTVTAQIQPPPKFAPSMPKPSINFKPV